MASNYKYYVPLPELFSVSTTATVGTSSTTDNAVEQHRLIRMDVDTVTGNAFTMRYDFSAAVTPDCIAFVEHNFYDSRNSPSSTVWTVSGASTSGGIYTGEDTNTAGSGSQPIIVSEFPSPSAWQYWKIALTDTTDTAYCGFCMLGTVVEPSIDANNEQPVEYDIESGRVITVTPDGFNWKKRTHGKKSGVSIRYESITTADKDILCNGLFADDYSDFPLVFTNDGGTTYYYAELIGNPIVVQIIDGLWDVNFTLVEVIA